MWAVVVLLSFFVVHDARAAEFYVSPTGRPDGRGSITNPWDLATALAHPPSVKPGDTIWLRGGTYRGTYTSDLTGSATNPIIVRQYPGERATIDGNTPTEPPESTLVINGAHTWYWGFEIMNSHPVRIGDEFAPRRGNGTVVYGNNTKLINLIIHDTAGGVGSWVSSINSELYGNIIYYNGGGYSSGPGWGHGIYAQNDTGVKRLADNIIFDQFGYGIHIYGEAGALNNFHVEGNVAFHNERLASSGIVYARNILLGGLTIAQNPAVTNNATYYPQNLGRNSLGYDAGCANPKITGNYFAGGWFALELINCTSGLTMTGNTFYGPVSFDPSDFPNNNYLTERPRGVKTFLRPNRYEPGRAHIAIYNWDLAPTVSLDVSSVLTPGDRYALHNVQDYWNDIVIDTYRGEAITVPMTGRTVAKPIGWTAPPSTFPEFGAFVLTKISTSTPDTPPPPPPSPRESPPPTAPPPASTLQQDSGQASSPQAAPPPGAKPPLVGQGEPTPSESPQPTQPTGTPPLPPQTPQAKKWPFILGGLAVIFILGLTIFLLGQKKPGPPTL